MTKNLKTGFTLIELLVVIAIIGLLSTIVLGSLQIARNKAADSAIKADLAGVLRGGQAELYYSTHGDTYGSLTPAAVCPTVYVAGSASLFSDDLNIVRAINDALSRSQNGSRCIATPTTWAVSVGLKTAGQYWCVDSTGNTVLEITPTINQSINGNKCA